MDEYTSSIAMGGRNTLVLHNTCEDSLLAIGVMLDLVVLVELVQRVAWRFEPPLPGETSSPHGFNALLAPLLAYLLKAPAVPDRTPAVNSLFRQRTTLENFLK
jgi:myo-inositol-1-phosphate synthase